MRSARCGARALQRREARLARERTARDARTGGTQGRGATPTGATANPVLAALARAKRAETAGEPATMKRAESSNCSRRLRELNPHPTTELEYTTPFELLVAVMLSAQATDVGVNKATRKLFPVANTPQAILELGEDGLKRYITHDRPVQHQGEERDRDCAGC